MGINTQGIMSKDVRLGEIVNVLMDKFNVTPSIEKTHDKNYFILPFKYKSEDRRLSVFLNYNDQEHVGFANMGNVTLIDVNCWGSSVELIKGIVEEFGGYFVENDCGDDWVKINQIK